MDIYNIYIVILSTSVAVTIRLAVSHGLTEASTVWYNILYAVMEV